MDDLRTSPGPRYDEGPNDRLVPLRDALILLLAGLMISSVLWIPALYWAFGLWGPFGGLLVAVAGTPVYTATFQRMESALAPRMAGRNSMTVWWVALSTTARPRFRFLGLLPIFSLIAFFVELLIPFISWLMNWGGV